MAAYYAALLLVGTGLVRYVGVPRNEPRRLWKLTFIPYISATLILSAGGLLNPIGIQLVWQSALPGSGGRGLRSAVVETLHSDKNGSRAGIGSNCPELRLDHRRCYRVTRFHLRAGTWDHFAPLAVLR